MKDALGLASVEDEEDEGGELEEGEVVIMLRHPLGRHYVAASSLLASARLLTV